MPITFNTFDDFKAAVLEALRLSAEAEVANANASTGSDPVTSTRVRFDGVITPKITIHRTTEHVYLTGEPVPLAVVSSENLQNVVRDIRSALIAQGFALEPEA